MRDASNSSTGRAPRIGALLAALSRLRDALRPSRARGAARPQVAGPDPLHELAQMRRYVPEPIADRISTGESLESGEGDVTVMFVDLRGYTAFAESLTPEQVFQFLNRYTGVVSRIVRRHGGFVVEFNGDGMMAVFGAPLSLPEKERQAVAAAREISRSVASLGSGPGSRAPEDATTVHRVGIGIATGPAFVGNIRAVDRTIWSAVGNTTNRASRLQTLARELVASIVVDAATHRAAGAPEGFEGCAPVAIPGMREPVEIYVLREPRARASAGQGVHSTGRGVQSGGRPAARDGSWLRRRPSGTRRAAGTPLAEVEDRGPCRPQHGGARCLLDLTSRSSAPVPSC